jgi:hypothetical protein
MAKYQSYRCPDCKIDAGYGPGIFVHMHLLADKGDTPDRCPLCQAWVNEDDPPDEAFVPQAPRIKKSPYGKSVDQTYRNMEEASILRADEAAGMLESQYAAQPKDEHDSLVRTTQKEEIAHLKSELKITNMRDPSEMREGDTAHIPKPANPAITTGAAYQPYAGSVSGAAVSPMVSTIKSFTANHTPRAMGMIRAGNMGTDRGR